MLAYTHESWSWIMGEYKWVQGEWFAWEIQVFKRFLMEIEVAVLDYSWRWRKDQSGNYIHSFVRSSIRFLYWWHFGKYLESESPSKDHFFFLWRLVRNRLRSGDNLLRRNVVVSGGCFFFFYLRIKNSVKEIITNHALYSTKWVRLP